MHLWWTHGILTIKHGGLTFFAEKPAKVKDRKAVGSFHASFKPCSTVRGNPINLSFQMRKLGLPDSFNLLQVRFFLLCDFMCPPRECPSILHAKRLVFFTHRVWPSPSHQLPGSHLHPSHLRVPLCNPQRGLRSSWSYDQTQEPAGSPFPIFEGSRMSCLCTGFILIFWDYAREGGKKPKTKPADCMEGSEPLLASLLPRGNLDIPCSATQSCLTLCDPYRLQNARLLCPSLSPGICSNSCSLSWWCHLTISSFATLFSSWPQSFPASGSFPMSQLFASGGKSIGASASASVLPMNMQGWFPLGWTGLISLNIVLW